MPNEDKASLNNVGVYFHIVELAISKTAMEISSAGPDILQGREVFLELGHSDKHFI